MKIHNQTLSSAANTTIVRMDSGLAVAVLDDPSSSSQQSQSAQLILTASSSASTTSSLSPTSSSLLLAAAPLSLTRLIDGGGVDDQHCLQIVQNGSSLHPDSVHSGGSVPNIATSTTSNVIIQANGGGGILLSHHGSSSSHHHHSNLIATSSSVAASTSSSALVTGHESLDPCSATTSTVVSIATPTTVSGSGIESAAGSDIMHIMTPEPQTGCYTENSLSIDIKDGIFEDDSDGYPENAATAASGGQQQGYVPLLPPAVGTNADQTDLKYYFEELCPVCGDKVSGYHYGLLTCESCKGFFKRTVQNKKVYTCVAERQCHIDKTQRKRCPFCRFQKCLEVGMKLEAVRADRMRGGRNKFGPMYKRDRARKLQIMRQRQLALQALRASEGGGGGGVSANSGNSSQLSPTGYQQPYSHMNIKQEIQIPQISSLTSSSPDSSPSPIAIALGQVSASGTTTALSLGSVSGSSGNGSGSGGNGNSTTSSGNLGPTNLVASNNSATSVQNTGTDSKLWFANSTTASPHSLSPKQFSFDTGTNPTSTEDTSTVEPLRVSPMIREFVQTVDDREWQTQLFSLLQSQSYNQCEVDLFELMCKVLDQNLFSQVDWARNTVFFKDLKVDDQMKLLQNSWSDMLVLDHLHQRIHNNLPDETTLHNGQKFDLLGLGLLGVPQLSDHFNEIQNKLQELKFDVGDYICMKFLLLLNPDVRGITNRKTVEEGYGNVQAALLDYTLTCYPSVTDKFSKLRSIIPEIHAMAARGEEHLYIKHCAGSAPTQTLLMEMLHAKRK